MPGHEFEKNVQQRLDELKLRPSDAVWQNVEESIRKDKRRRRMILWLPILLLFLGTSGYFLISKQNTIPAQTAIKNNKTEKENTVKTSTQTNQETDKNSVQNKEDNQQAPEKESNEIVAENKTKQSQSAPITSAIPSAKSRKKTTSKLVAVSTIDNVDKTPGQNKGQESINPNSSEKNVAVHDNEELIDYSKLNLSLIGGITPVVSIEVPNTHSGVIETPAVDLNSLPKPNSNEKYRSSKWQWGLDLGVGKSSASSEISFLKSASMDNFNTGGSPSTNTDRASSIDPGFYWSAGGFVQRNFSNWFALSTGLKYAQYSTRIHTGVRVDSSRSFFNSGNFATVDNYYRNGKGNEYTNRYHFLELPVTAHAKLNKSNSFPLYANLGLSVSWLLGTNSLNYDGSSGAYYQDDEIFNKTQFGLHGGLSFGVLNKTKYPLRIGPSFNYKLSGLMENVSSNKHLLSFGVDFRLLLKK